MNRRYLYRFEPFGTLCFDNKKNKVYVDYGVKEFPYDDIRIIDNRYFNAPLLGAPLNVFLEITQNCNSECIHCINKREKKTKDISLDNLKVIIDKLYNSGIFLIKISGGEPFCRNDIFKILDYIETKNIKYIIYTNGTYIDENVAFNLQGLSNLLCLRVSIDGLQETNDAIRGKGMFDIAIRALKLLSNNKIPCEANYTICYKNYKEISDLIMFMKKQGIDAKMNVGTLKISGGVLKNKELIIPEDKVLDIMDIVRLQIIHNESVVPFKLLPEVYFKLYGNSFGCPAGRLAMSINNRGEVFGCGMLADTEEFNCGNLIYEELNEIWGGRQMNRLRTLVTREECLSCSFFQEECTGACRGNALNCFCDIQERDINCGIYKINYETND